LPAQQPVHRVVRKAASERRPYEHLQVRVLCRACCCAALWIVSEVEDSRDWGAYWMLCL
jgi:hypothetical protein